MGWGSGSELMDDVINIIEEHTPKGTDKVLIFKELIRAFEDHDCDTLCDCLAQSPNFDEAYEELYPEDDDEV